MQHYVWHLLMMLVMDRHVSHGVETAYIVHSLLEHQSVHIIWFKSRSHGEQRDWSHEYLDSQLYRLKSRAPDLALSPGSLILVEKIMEPGDEVTLDNFSCAYCCLGNETNDIIKFSGWCYTSGSINHADTEVNQVADILSYELWSFLCFILLTVLYFSLFFSMLLQCKVSHVGPEFMACTIRSAWVHAVILVPSSSPFKFSCLLLTRVRTGEKEGLGTRVTGSTQPASGVLYLSLQAIILSRKKCLS